MHRILALWAVPRSISTAFERMVIERGDHTVFDEPFSAAYYFGVQRRSDRFDETLPGADPRLILASVRAAAEERPVFVKDMAYQALPYLETSDLRDLTHTVLVRDPRRALPSLERRWPDVTPDEAGYTALREMCARIREATGRGPVVVEAEALRRSPETVVRAWCEAVGIRFVPEALTWAPGMQPQWRVWRDWYEAAARSTGFLPPNSSPPPEVGDERIRTLIEECLPIYEELRAQALAG